MNHSIAYTTRMLEPTNTVFRKFIIVHGTESETRVGEKSGPTILEYPKFDIFMCSLLVSAGEAVFRSKAVEDLHALNRGSLTTKHLIPDLHELCRKTSRRDNQTSELVQL